MFPVLKAQFEKAVPKQSAEVDTVHYTEHVTFSFSARLPRAKLHSRNRRARRVFKNLSASNPQRECELDSPAFEWVDYSAPSVCLEEEEDGACLREEPAPCSEDPSALVCSIDTRQLPQKRKRRPWVSLVIDDMGVDTWASERAVRLRPAVTLSYLPYGPQVRQQARAAAAAGHELMVHLPMEPFNKAADAGPNALHSSMAPHQLKEHLHWALSQFDGYVGLNNHMGSLFTSRSPGGMTVVLEELQKRELFFLDSLTATDSLGQELAAHLGTTFGARDVFLDSQRGAVSAVGERLQEVEQLAHKNGHAIAIGHPYDETLEALEKWLPLLHSKGLVLMPLKKALLRERKERERAAGEAVLAFTRAKQLRAIQAQRDRAWQERQAKLVAAELEQAFGDGTVLAWQGLQDAGVEKALRAALARQRPPSGSLKASLQRLLAAPFWGGKTEEPQVEKAAARLLRRRGHPQQRPDLLATRAGGLHAHALLHPKLPDMVRRGRGRARGGRGLVDNSLPMLAVRDDVKAVQQEGARCEEAGPGGDVERMAGSKGPPRLVGKRRRGRQDRVPRAEVGQPCRQQRQAGDEAHLGGASQEGSGATAEWAPLSGHPLSWTTGEDSNEAAADLRRGVLVAAALQQSRGRLNAPGGRTGPGGSGWRGGARAVRAGGGEKDPAAAQQRGGEANEGAMQRWLAQLGGGKLSAGSSPRSVIVPEALEEPADASSPEHSAPGSRTPSLSSSEVSTCGTGPAVLEGWSSPARSSSSSDDVPSSLSEASSGEEAGPAGGAAWRAALQSASTVAAALAVAMHLAAHARRKTEEAAQANPPRLAGPSGFTAAIGGPEQSLGPEMSANGVSPKKATRCSFSRLEMRPAAELSVKAAAPASSAARPAAQAGVRAAAGKEEVLPSTASGADADGAAGSLARPACHALAALEKPTQDRPPLALTPAEASGEELPTQPQTGGHEARPACQPAASPEGNPADGIGAPAVLQQTDHAGRELRRAGLVAPGVPGQRRARAVTSEEGGRASQGPAVLVALRQQGEAEQGAAQPVCSLPGAVDVAGAPGAASGAAGAEEAQLEEPGSPTASGSLSAEPEWCDAEAEPVSPASTPSSCAASGVQGSVACQLAAGGRVQYEYTSTGDGPADAVHAPLGSTAVGTISELSKAMGRCSGEGARSTASKAGAGVQGNIEAEQSKKFGWWRWTVGCVLGGFEDAGTRESGDRMRPAALHGKRRVVPLDVDDPQ
ncbi:Divergent polysaccharide deacetylase superfamily [Klebsormidium nitens]|uniref:Divergent polysaccharide deacetylase superfamily n=1 Tax=Klebsormidium nitens TaxID=105231 RepID=A0A1Y1I0E2_KLENI|nr:Divergent polysaccharide deacetylase superfamily [Klebsormidium nitens]|eukprot:GAQ84384.1 Divergent polysaccharide deacetylase superfamily [Klebsormidium nitens]